MAEFLQQGEGSQVHIQQSVVELVGIHINAFKPSVADGRIGRKGTTKFAIGAQVNVDLQAVAADSGEQGLLVGLKRGWIGAGAAEHIGEDGIAVGIAEQVGQVVSGLGPGLLPDRFRLGI